LAFTGRYGDVITSSGYRVGPGEIENSLLGHPAIRTAAVDGKPDAERTGIVKAYVERNYDTQADVSHADAIQDWVKTRLAAHEYPREIEFVQALPMTTTGKVIRRELREQARREAGTWTKVSS